MDIESMSKDDLERLQVEKETEYQLAMQSLNVVELKDNELGIKITEMQLERKRLDQAIIQSKYNLRRLGSELRNIKTMIYRRLSGL